MGGPRPFRHYPPSPALRCCNCLIYTLQLLFCCGLCWLCRCGCYDDDDYPYNPPPNEYPHNHPPPGNDNKGGYQSIPQQEQQDMAPSAPLVVQQDIQQNEGGTDVAVTLS